MTRVGIVGCGYVGLVTGASLAARGHRVLCVDTDAARVSAVASGRAPFFEPGLDRLLEAEVGAGRLEASTDIARILDTEIALLAVGTPSDDAGRLDTRYLESAARDLAEAHARRPGTLRAVFVKSTVLPGVTRNVVARRLGFAKVGMMPEFLREGCAVEDAMKPDRIVVGADDPELFAAARLLFCGKDDPQPFETTIETAELIKYTNNALLALLVSFSNEIARVAESVPGVVALDVMKGVLMDRRWNTPSGQPSINAYLKPGCGFGGSCFPKDVRALSAFANDAGVDPRVVPAILEINRGQPAHFVDLCADAAPEGLRNKTALVLGLAFKPDTSDVRESAAFGVVSALADHGAHVAIHDPVAIEEFAKAGGAERAGIVRDWRTSAREADAILLVTAWKEYLDDLPAVLEQRSTPVVLADGRGAFSNRAWPRHVRYAAIGKG